MDAAMLTHNIDDLYRICSKGVRIVAELFILVDVYMSASFKN
jgi:hypothetical protein